jgi:hypothetical protein
LTTPDPEGLRLTYKRVFGVFGTCPMRSAIQIHDPMPLRETVFKGLGHFQRFPGILQVKIPKVDRIPVST